MSTIVELAPAGILDSVKAFLTSLRRRRRTQALTYKGGPLLSAIEIVPIFYGSGWLDPNLQADIGDIVTFLNWFPSSSVVDELSQYSVLGLPIGHGTCDAAATIPDILASQESDATIRQVLAQEIAGGKLPKPNPNTLYIFYVEPGVQVVDGTAASCTVFCGYHDEASVGVYYAVMPYPTCSGCLGGLTALDALTSTSSHELCEAITDPRPGTGWVDTANGEEIGDLCAWKTKVVDGHTVQLEWSNSAKGCI